MGELDKRFRLLVEGKDDSAAIRHLMMRHQYDWADGKWVVDVGGFEQVIESLDVSAKTYQRLGVVVDADTNLGSRWGSLVSALRNAGLTLPSEPDSAGTVIAGRRGPNSLVGVWIMPNNVLTGALEDFLSTLVPSGDALWPYAEDCCKGALDKGAPITGSNFLKAKLHTWLAWKDEPGRPYGTAITASYLGADSEQASAFVEWFKRLFVNLG